MTANAGYLFYKKSFEVFSDEDWKKIASGEIKEKRDNDSKKVKSKLENDLDGINHKIETLKPTFHSSELVMPGIKTIKLKTTNPGLLIGSGYSHETGIENEFKIGFFFDHTTGLPVIPGSSVKGVLRSVFPRPYDSREKQAQKRNYLKSRLKDNPDTDLDVLEKAVFEGIGDQGKRIPLSRRDVFFDAVIIKTMGDSGKIFGKDSITPHKDPLKNPIPLKFLKVLPGVDFMFQFRLSDQGGVSAENKKKLFETILCHIGVGAKTNVGYGQLVKA